MKRGSDWWDKWYLGMAEYASTASKDPSTKTGAVIVGPNKRVVSIGFNGFAAGMKDDDKLYADRAIKYSRVIHCEVNALLFAGSVPLGSTLYTWPFLSCDRCAVLMIQAGIRTFVAPRPSEDALSRWGDALGLAASYIVEAGGEIREIDILKNDEF